MIISLNSLRLASCLVPTEFMDFCNYFRLSKKMIAKQAMEQGKDLHEVINKANGLMVKSLLELNAAYVKKDSFSSIIEKDIDKSCYQLVFDEINDFFRIAK